MHWDNSMGTTIDGEWVPMKPNNSNLNEDLGKIDHIFSDKTGTVTQNVMRLAAWATPDNVFSEEEGNRGTCHLDTLSFRDHLSVDDLKASQITPSALS